MTSSLAARQPATSRTASEQLVVNEIFYSLQGETRFAGLPTVFIRLTGCPLRCQYCDTAYAFDSGKKYAIDQILSTVAEYATTYVTVTGGEPLAQKPCLLLLQRLCDANYTVTLETSGALDVAFVDNRVHKILDVKTPGSNESDKNRFANFEHLLAGDEVKFVICDHDDYLWAKMIIEQHDLANRCNLLFSASHQQLQAQELADWILADQLPVRMQLQLHKYLWGDCPGR